MELAGEVTVPITWLFYVAASLIGLFVWWTKAEFNRNDKAHDEMKREVVGIHKRIDHMIINTPGMPVYKDT